MSYAATKAAYKARRVADGGCIDCAAGKAEEGHRRCADCAERHRAKNRKGPGRSKVLDTKPRARESLKVKPQLARFSVRPLDSIKGQSPSTAEWKPSQAFMLRRDPPPRKPVVILDGVKGHVEMPGPKPAKCEVAMRAATNVVLL